MKRPDFEQYKSHLCHRLKWRGDIQFIIDVLEKDEIMEHFHREWYLESLYLLALLDYLSRIHDVPLCSDYDDLRCCRFEKTIYPRDLLLLCAVTKDDRYMAEAEKKAIPEFLRHNILECDVRNVA